MAAVARISADLLDRFVAHPLDPADEVVESRVVVAVLGSRQELGAESLVVDPSAVVGKDFLMTVVLTADGRVWNGLVAAKTDKTLTLQTQTDRKTIDLDDIEEIQRTPQSPMPDGLLDNLSEDQIRDLIAYLMQGAQVALPAGADIEAQRKTETQ